MIQFQGAVMQYLKKKSPTDPKELKGQNNCRPSLCNFTDPYCSVEMSSKDKAANVKTAGDTACAHGNTSLSTSSTGLWGGSECRLPNRNGVWRDYC